MKRLVYILIACLMSGFIAVGCADESAEDKNTEDNATTETTDADSSEEPSDEDDDEEEAEEDYDYTDKSGNREDKYAPGDNEAWSDNNKGDEAAANTDKKNEPVPEEEFNDDFDFDTDIEDVFDTSPDPDPSEFVKVDQSPKFLNESEVRSSIKAPYNNASGKVYAKILVGLDGKYRTHYIRRSPDKALSKAVVEGMELAKFKPAMKDGEPVKVWVDFFYEFK